MTRALFAAALFLAPGGLAAQALLPVPSGQAVWLQEVRDEAEAGILRFRFVAPDIARDAGKVTFAEIEADLEALCREVALPAITGKQAPAQIVISLADREVEFGQADPEATQFFEAFTVQDNACIWEGF